MHWFLKFIFGIKFNMFRTVPLAISCQLSANLYDIYHCCVQWKTPDDGQRNCPKHVEFYSKNKFEKLVYLVGFIIRIYHDAWSPERQIIHSNITRTGNIYFMTTVYVSDSSKCPFRSCKLCSNQRQHCWWLVGGWRRRINKDLFLFLISISSFSTFGSSDCLFFQ